jgi:hypothetical protein
LKEQPSTAKGTTDETLDRLRHVSGVLGSFTCCATGQLLATDMPEHYTRADLEGAAARLSNMFQTVDEAVSDCKNLRLAFADHQLHIRRYRAGLLCVLTAAEFDRQMLRVTTRLVIRRLIAL